ncbi:hypothetical protein H0H87_002105 [Tephrocybe sp. NHM501043]|nr:hypothetical protein H0H87_002105 [Tephrocybe sp. NHM501043]
MGDLSDRRKNGLFKKAHELGVLCSVDVAVIIFDDRHGHDTKLFQYSSSDVRDIVQRHLRHNGERDTRGPADFSGEGAGVKNDAGGDGDDDDDDGDAEEPPPPPPKKSNATSRQNKDDDEFKPSARVIVEAEPPKHRSSASNERSAPERTRSSSHLSTLPPLPQFDYQHPVSSDRLHPLHTRPYQEQPQSKKARLDYGLDMDIPRSHGHPLSAASSEDSMHRPHEVYMYPPHAPPPRRSSDASHHDHHPSQYGPYGVPYPTSPPPGHHGPGSGYGTSPFTSSPDLAAFGVQMASWGRPQGPGNGPGSGGLSSFFTGAPGGPMGSSSFDFTRGDDGRVGPPNEKSGIGRDTFAHTFLEADQQQRKVALPQGGMSISRGTTSAASFGIDWPSHRSTTSQPVAPLTPPAATTPKSAGTAPEINGAAHPPDAGGPGWLDLLSGTGEAATAASTNTLSGSSETPIPTPKSGSAAPTPSSSGP